MKNKENLIILIECLLKRTNHNTLKEWSSNNFSKSVQIVQQALLQFDSSGNSQERKLFLSQGVILESSTGRMQLINAQTESVRNEFEILKLYEFTELGKAIVIFIKPSIMGFW